MIPFYLDAWRSYLAREKVTAIDFHKEEVGKIEDFGIKLTVAFSNFYSNMIRPISYLKFVRSSFQIRQLIRNKFNMRVYLEKDWSYVTAVRNWMKQRHHVSTDDTAESSLDFVKNSEPYIRSTRHILRVEYVTFITWRRTFDFVSEYMDKERKFPSIENQFGFCLL